MSWGVSDGLLDNYCGRICCIRLGNMDGKRQAVAQILSTLYWEDAMTAYGNAVSTMDELDTLDSDEIIEGYFDGRNNEPEPQGNRSKSYWHGWRNGMIDGKHMKPDAASKVLARVVIAAGRVSRP